ncbi:hypothetical protein GRF29_1g986533 [Pseudopithomyces chartarum]|uniref:GPI anchored protein n=1 Tax=Pseudopithomyces chartarum TaxID=1892770 RepID=A0AAN6M7T0_9PLEO|nr:hypothetical protein GRF29_1g986533 [Pseudopithomyces chartarum]
MKHLLLPIFALAAAVAGASSSGDLPPWMYVSTVTSDTYITVPCTGRPLPIDCEVNSWTDTTVTLTLTKGPTVVLTREDYDYDEPETTTTSTERCPSGLPNRIPGVVCPTPSSASLLPSDITALTGTGSSVSTPTSPPPTTGESGSTGSPSPTVATTSESSAPEQSQGAAVGKNMRAGSTIVGGFLAVLAIL